jgi:diguanylate cyclase (GGDEF)-like protein
LLVIRLLLGFLSLAAPVVLGILLLAAPAPTLPWFEAGERSLVAAVAAAAIGVCVTTGVVNVLLQLRLRRLVRAAEKIAGGDYTVKVTTDGGGLETRLATAINGISASLADTYDRATVDRLTGVFNRQTLLAELFVEVERASRYDRPLSVAFVDIDQFKVINDTYGHEAGDLVLRGVAQLLGANLRASDMLGRYGGEEFMLILTETDPEEGAILSEKLRELVERQQFAIDAQQNVSVTVSIGVVGGFGSELRMEALVRNADAAMYSAKSLGRNQTYVFAEPNEDARVPRAPISAAGRARAVEIGRHARDAAVAALLGVIAPLPRYRGRPSALTSTIVVAMARTLQLPDAEVDRIQIAAMLHDIGKIAVPDEILDKPSALTSAEWRSVVQHPRIGQIILEQAAALKDAVPIILHHHEQFAGHGYPYGLRATEIPLGARIVAIADAYDAMVNEGPHRHAMSHEAAIDELRRRAGSQFDPELVAVFCDLFATRAPKPDPAMLALMTPAAIHERRLVANAVSAVTRHPQVTHPPAAASETTAPNGTVSIDLGEGPSEDDGPDDDGPPHLARRGRMDGWRSRIALSDRSSG